MKRPAERPKFKRRVYSRGQIMARLNREQKPHSVKIDELTIEKNKLWADIQSTKKKKEPTEKEQEAAQEKLKRMDKIHEEIRYLEDLDARRSMVMQSVEKKLEERGRK